MNITQYIGRKLFFKQLVRCYHSIFNDKLVSIVLFGSQARMDSYPESDYDIFIIAEGLPSNILKRLFLVRQPIIARFKEKISTISKTPEEFEKGFPSLYLDLALDGKILYDRNRYFQTKRNRIKQIIKESNLVRRKEKNEFSWDWIKSPVGGWAIDWSGFHELSK